MNAQLIAIDERVMGCFSRLIRQDRLAHAYLFIGPESIGKSETALAVAQLANCEQNAEGLLSLPCGECPSCRKILSGNHPDVQVIGTGEESSIKIARVRALIETLQLRPYEGRWKITIINELESLTVDGANALLKTLEEPSANSLLMLTTAAPERILSTVRSRCHPVHFFAGSRDSLAARLLENGSADASSSQVLAHFAEGCAGAAGRLLESGFIEEKNAIIDNMVFAGNNDAYLKQIVEDKDRVQRVLKVLLFWFRDLILLKAGVERDRLSHQDRIDQLEKMAPRYTLRQLQAVLRGIANTARLAQDNLNVRIALMVLREQIWARS